MALIQSQASWRKAHGFGLLCIHSPLGESFVVVPDDDALVTMQPSWRRMSEIELRADLKGRGLTEAESTEAVELARDWATTFSPEDDTLSLPVLNFLVRVRR